MPIVPDDKDWTWVLGQVCQECGFDSAAVDRDEMAGRIAATSRAWEEILGRPGVRQRPDDDTWSPLEYACHVRDVHRVYAGRVGRMLTEDDPHYENWDQDVTAVEERYGEQDPAVVATELTAAGEEASPHCSRCVGRGMDTHRPAQRRGVFTVDSISRYYLPRHRAPPLGRRAVMLGAPVRGAPGGGAA